MAFPKLGEYRQREMESWILLKVVGVILSMMTLLDLSLASQGQQHLIAELQECQLKVSRLESELDEITRKLEARDSHLLAYEEQVMKMEEKIIQLQSSLSKIKGDSSSSIQKIKELEDEVRALWATSRKNNFDLHVLEFEVQEAEDRVEVLSSQVEKFADIVAEQWIQIQQFEHALQLREMRITRARMQVRPPRCPFLKFMNGLYGKYLPKDLSSSGGHLFGRESLLRSQTTQIVHYLTRCYSTIKRCHHEVQGSVKREMERYSLTASFVNDELVFFVASALILFPALGAWTLLSSWLTSV